MFGLLQIVLFLTDSVLDAQFTCFDEIINFYQCIKPWKSYITVDTMQKKNELVCNITQSSDCFIILTNLTEFSVEVLCG